MEGALASFIAKGTPSGWTLCVLALGGIIILLKILAAQRPRMREMEIEADEAKRAAENAANTQIRAELRDEMKALRDEVKALRDENRGLRDEIKALHGVIDGMRRENLQAGISAQRAVMGTLPRDLVPERTRQALDRMEGVGE